MNKDKQETTTALAKPVSTKEKLAEIVAELDMQDKFGKFNELLNAKPKDEWIKDHPFNNGRYLPIERVEHLLRTIFGWWQVEVKEFRTLGNSLVVHVKLTVKHPVTLERYTQDGLGAVPIQVDKDADPTDASKMKSDAIMKGLPAAESYAIKDAAEKFGRLFGSDVGRKDTIAFQNLYEQAVN